MKIKKIIKLLEKDKITLELAIKKLKKHYYRPNFVINNYGEYYVSFRNIRAFMDSKEGLYICVQIKDKNDFWNKDIKKALINALKEII